MNFRSLAPFVVLLIINTVVFSATLPATEDSYGYRAKLTTVANRATLLPVDSAHRAYLYFDVAHLPPGTALRYARLRFFLPKVVRPGSGLGIHTVTGTWDETIASTEPPFISAASKTIPEASLRAKRFVSVDITATVQSWIDTPSSNEGLAITAIPGATKTLTASVSIGSKEGSGSGYPAELEIEIADGQVGSSQLAPNLTLAGTTTGIFAGNGAGLTNLSIENFVGTISGNQIGAGVVGVSQLESSLAARITAMENHLQGTTSLVFSTTPEVLRWGDLTAESTVSGVNPSSIPDSAKAILVNVWTYSSGSDHVNHTFGRRVEPNDVRIYRSQSPGSGTETTFWTLPDFALNDVVVSHAGESGSTSPFNWGFHHGTSIIPLKADGTFDARLCSGHSSGTHEVVLYVVGYLKSLP